MPHITSVLNPKIKYSDYKEIEKTDHGNPWKILETVLFDDKPDKNYEISLGRMNCIHEHEGVCYISVYLAKDKIIQYRIGVIEYDSAEKTKFADKSGNINLSAILDSDNFYSPLFFPDFIKSEGEGRRSPRSEGKSAHGSHGESTPRSEGKNARGSHGESAPRSEGKSARGSHGEGTPRSDSLTPGTAKVEIKKFDQFDGRDTWLHNYMGGDKKFRIVRTTMSGSCFFDSILKALKSAEPHPVLPRGIHLPVGRVRVRKEHDDPEAILYLRSLVADSLAEKQYVDTKRMYHGLLFGVVDKICRGHVPDLEIEMIEAIDRTDSQKKLHYDAFYSVLRDKVDAVEKETPNIGWKKYNEVRYNLSSVLEQVAGVRVSDNDAKMIYDKVKFLFQGLEEEFNKKKGTHIVTIPKDPNRRDSKDIVTFDFPESLTDNISDLEDETHLAKNVATVRAMMTENDWWASEATMDAIETILKIKIITISLEEMGLLADRRANDNPPLRGQFDYTEENIISMRNNDLVDPKYYIMVEKTPAHYRLITYGGIGLFTNFRDLPPQVIHAFSPEQEGRRKRTSAWENIPEIVQYYGDTMQRASSHRKSRGKGGTRKKKHKRRITKKRK
jgi:hypothetical protein